jgi:hypothetical protein
VVRKQENGLIFHDQIGHWMFEPATGFVMHSLTIPPGFCVLEGGSIEVQISKFTFNVRAKQGRDTFGILQSLLCLKKLKQLPLK